MVERIIGSSRVGPSLHSNGSLQSLICQRFSKASLEAGAGVMGSLDMSTMFYEVSEGKFNFRIHEGRLVN